MESVARAPTSERQAWQRRRPYGRNQCAVPETVVHESITTEPADSRKRARSLSTDANRRLASRPFVAAIPAAAESRNLDFAGRLLQEYEFLRAAVACKFQSQEVHSCRQLFEFRAR